MTFINGVENEVLLDRNYDTVSVTGVSNLISIGGISPGDVVADHGLGTIISMDGTDLTIQDFASDPTGVVQLPITPAQAVAAEQPDGHGGTLLVYPNPFAPFGGPTATLDFAHDPHVSIGHFAEFAPIRPIP
jgi:hypothetical protein